MTRPALYTFRYPAIIHVTSFIVFVALLSIVTANRTLFLILGWLLLVPIIASFIISRMRTELSVQGITTHSIGTDKMWNWEQTKGIRFTKSGRAKLMIKDGTEHTLPAVSLANLDELADHSGGRITL